MELRKFVVPEFLFGRDARHLAARYAANFAVRRALVVSDPGVVKAGWTGELTALLELEGIAYHLFTGVSENPRAAEVMAGAEIYEREQCNLIIVVGGGSPIDCAKGIAVVNSNQKHILELGGIDEIEFPGPPLICIPTTAGSAADLSQFAIINDEERQAKIAIVSKAVVPDVSLIDPLTTVTMDPRLTACTGFDVIVHAIEAYVSNACSPLTDPHALAALRLAAVHLAPAVAAPENLAAREGMMLASTHAGMAFSNASLGAVHALAHCLGGFTDMVHGEAIAILLRHVIDFNYPAVPERYQDIAEAMGLPAGTADAKGWLLARLEALQLEVGLNRSLGAFGMSPAALAALARQAVADPCMVTNPREISVEEAEALYERAF